MNQKHAMNHAHKEVDHIFRTLLPKRGLAIRPAQIELCHTMLRTMIGEQIALCDAGTGSGKTFAYLVAGIVFQKYRQNLGLPRRPVLISTSSIALQQAMMEAYLPLLSESLVADGLLNKAITAVIRKGKRHYVCDQRLANRILWIDGQRKNPQTKEALLSMYHSLDLSQMAGLSNFEREQICVPSRCDCDIKSCRYRRFVEDCRTNQFDFQICNHNLFLADSLHRKMDKPPIFPNYAAAVLDEAHKLPDTARTMFSTSLSADQIDTFIDGLKQDRLSHWAKEFAVIFAPLLVLLRTPFDPNDDLGAYQGALILPKRVLQNAEEQLGKYLSPRNRGQMTTLIETLCQLYYGSTKVFRFMEQDAHGGTQLCASPIDLAMPLSTTLWHRYQPVVLTSGTLAVGDSFVHFKGEVGLASDHRVVETVSPSPFDYGENCLLYFPEKPAPLSSKQYSKMLTAQIAELIQSASGHTLVLFTSYSAMSAVDIGLKEKNLPYPVFTMGRSSTRALSRFQSTPGSVLLATGSAWEGMDFPGDCVSLLVIPRLPFPFPDARKEQEKSLYPSLQDFIQSVVLPEMQMKLRQGFGRAIRTETDTCVVAILDERASVHGRYHNDVLDALPEIPVTDQSWQIEAFLRRTKEDVYFQEGRT